MRNRRIGIGIRIRRRAPRPRLDRIRRVVPSNAELVKTRSRSLSLMLDRQLSWNAVLHRCFQDRAYPCSSKSYAVVERRFREMDCGFSAGLLARESAK